MPQFRFHHGAISVPDLDRAIAWYGETLGYTLEKRFSVPPAHSRAAMLRKDDMRVEVFEIAGAAPLPPERRSVPGDLGVHGNKHVAYRVADFEAA
ncbi:MAG TPA: VOC family protein, partial [Novosphingobium sp.]|nr:VOC family protein [Novosphingobium sp.]